MLSITGAKLYFIVAGYAVQLLLPRLLGTPEAFGLYSSAMNVVSILNNVLVAATLQSVSKHVSEDLAAAPATLRQGLLLQLAVGGGLALGLWALSPVLASRPAARSRCSRRCSRSRRSWSSPTRSTPR